MKAIDSFLFNEFIFSPRYRLWRHIIYWFFHTIVWSVFWIVMGAPTSFARNMLDVSMWIPVIILFSYPLVYGAIPHLLLKGRVVQFFVLILAWGAFGLYINSSFITYFYAPLQKAMGFDLDPVKTWQPHTYLCLTTSSACPMIIKFFKLWSVKQRDWMRAQQEKITAELQLLKAQVHPHFLFNTLNNIYSFSMDNSPKTPDMILKLSSLLSYMLYDCKSEEVPLEKEIENMQNYIDLEKERYGNRIEISWSVDGNLKNKFISPLLMLPFLENAFKHGVSEQLEKPWLSVDISVESDSLRCKIANGKDMYVSRRTNSHGIGITNVKKRLALMYPDKHELKMHDEGVFFVISLFIKLTGYTHSSLAHSRVMTQPITV